MNGNYNRCLDVAIVWVEDTTSVVVGRCEWQQHEQKTQPVCLWVGVTGNGMGRKYNQFGLWLDMICCSMNRKYNQFGLWLDMICCSMDRKYNQFGM